MYAAALNGSGTSTIGIGTNLSTVAQQFTQGNVTTTENPMDLAINGAGFFQVSDGKSPVTYTRNGQFKIDREGFIVNNNQDRLMGYAADGTGVIQLGQAVALQLPTGGIDPKPTSRAAIEVNLDARKAVTLPAAAPMVDFANANTYNNATSLTVFDAKGQDVALSFYFQKSGNDMWNLYGTANGTSLAGTNAAPQPVTSIQFRSNGSGPLAPAGPITFDVPSSTNAVGAVTEPIIGMVFDLSGATQFGSAYGVTDIPQDGYAAGLLTVDRGRKQRHRHRALFQRAIEAGRADRDRQLPQPAGAAAAGRQRLGAHLCLGRPGGRRARRRQPGRAAGRCAGRIEHRPDRRAGEHDHRAAHLPGQRADHQDAGPGAADAGQPALNAEPQRLRSSAWTA